MWWSPFSPSLRFRLCLSLGLLSASTWLASPSWADIMTSSRIGGGLSRYTGLNGATGSTFNYQGTLRVAYLDPGSKLFVALDGTAYRFAALPRLGMTIPVNGNNLSLALGSYRAPWGIWVSGGGGQLRTYDRQEQLDDPLHWKTDEWQAGASYDVYRADYGKLELCMLYRRLKPEAEWQQRYQTELIEALQFELGFKFLDW